MHVRTGGLDAGMVFRVRMDVNALMDAQTDFVV
jgi:hypothetical protein